MNIDWVEIPAGEYSLGLTETQIEKICAQIGPDESPWVEKRIRTLACRRVSLPRFWIARYPITYAQVKAFQNELETRPGSDEPENFPAQVTWKTASAFCKWIGGRLPSADEWLAAAQGPTPHLYPWGDEWNPSRGNFTGYPDQPGYPATAKGIVFSRATPGDAYPDGVSPFGVWDMAGNLSEWTCTPYRAPMDPNGGYYLVMGHSVWNAKDNQDLPLWRENILAKWNVGSVKSPPFYIGFRPVKG